MVIVDVEVEIDLLFLYVVILVVVIPYAAVREHGRLVVGVERHRERVFFGNRAADVVCAEIEFEVEPVFTVVDKPQLFRGKVELDVRGNGTAAVCIGLGNAVRAIL